MTVCIKCNSVGVVTRYGLDGPGRRDFQHPSRPALGPTQPSYIMGTGSFPEVKWQARGVDHPSSSSACSRVNFTLTLPLHITLVSRKSSLRLSVAVPFTRTQARKTKLIRQ